MGTWNSGQLQKIRNTVTHVSKPVYKLRRRLKVFAVESVIVCFDKLSGICRIFSIVSFLATLVAGLTAGTHVTFFPPNSGYTIYILYPWPTQGPRVAWQMANVNQSWDFWSICSNSLESEVWTGRQVLFKWQP
jgi:hypothetical protein